MRRTAAPFTTRRPRCAWRPVRRERGASGGGDGAERTRAGCGVAMSHGHSHGGGGCRCAAEREEPPEQRGLAYGLYLRIDLERLQCLNESREGSGRGVFKPWEERTDRSKVGLARPGAATRGRGPPACPAGLVPGGRNNGSPIAERFPAPILCWPFGSRAGSSLPILQIEKLRPGEGKGAPPAFCSGASVGSEGGWP